MRLNQFIASATGLSRRAADTAISEQRVRLNGQPATLGQQVTDSDRIELDGQLLRLATRTTIMLHKPVGYVCSRDGQGSQTIYELLPEEYRSLKPVGRLDKDSSGLLLLTDDGHLANQLTHPRYAKEKIYEITLDKPLTAADNVKLEQGIEVEDYISRLQLAKLENQRWQVTITQGRNRQIRRTFEALGYDVRTIHRTAFGPYKLDGLVAREYKTIKSSEG